MGEICWQALCRSGLRSRVMDHLSGFFLVISSYCFGTDVVTTRGSPRTSTAFKTSISLACAAIPLTVHLLPCYQYYENGDRSEGLAASLKCTIFTILSSVKRLGANVTIRARGQPDIRTSQNTPSRHLGE